MARARRVGALVLLGGLHAGIGATMSGTVLCRKQARSSRPAPPKRRHSRRAQAADWPRLAGAWGGLHEACSGAESSLRSAGWPKPEPAWFRHRHGAALRLREPRAAAV
eukprot:scaffold114599_cov67-Phaeocystis_antarctica.AAC.1